MKRSARFSRCRHYRYALDREWDPDAGRLLFIGLNPSTADETVDDATIRRLYGFALAWGYGSMTVANLFAWRTPYPHLLRTAVDPVGPGNDRWLRRLIDGADLVVAAWGANGSFLQRAVKVAPYLKTAFCFGLTRSGQPLHPLYLPATAKPIVPFRSPATDRDA